MRSRKTETMREEKHKVKQKKKSFQNCTALKKRAEIIKKVYRTMKTLHSNFPQFEFVDVMFSYGKERERNKHKRRKENVETQVARGIFLIIE